MNGSKYKRAQLFWYTYHSSTSKSYCLSLSKNMYGQTISNCSPPKADEKSLLLFLTPPHRFPSDNCYKARWCLGLGFATTQTQYQNQKCRVWNVWKGSESENRLERDSPAISIVAKEQEKGWSSSHEINVRAERGSQRRRIGIGKEESALVSSDLISERMSEMEIRSEMNQQKVKKYWKNISQFRINH